MNINALVALFSVIGAGMIACAFLLGLYLSGLGVVMQIQKWTPTNKSNNPNSPAWTFVSGVLLLLAPLVYGLTMNTVTSQWDSSISLYAIDEQAISDIDQNQNSLMAFLPRNSVLFISMFIYAYGLYAYLKGIYLFRYAGTMGQDGRTQGKVAFAHFAGGLFVMNIQPISCVLLSFFVSLSYC